MSFSVRCIPCLSPSYGFPRTYFERFKSDERGRCSVERVFDDDNSLPDPSSYDLAKMIDAGVPLQETRTNVIAPKADALLDVPSTNGEDVDE